MKLENLKGSCLCGQCTYSIAADPHHFFQCHCVQCRKMTGSAFAANIIAAPTEIHWLSGADKLTRYDYPGRVFTQVFCSICGSGLPFIDEPGEMLFVPAGTLDNAPTIQPEANIFWGERAQWYEHGVRAPRQETFDEV